MMGITGFHNSVLYSSVGLLFLALLVMKPVVLGVVFNLVISLLGICVGCALGVLIMVKLLNHLETHKLNVETTNTAAQLNSDSRIFVNLSRFQILSRCYHWGSIKVTMLFQSLISRLAASPLIKSQTEANHTRASVRGRGLYEIIRPYGQTPDDMLASAYGPTAYGTGSTVCVSHNIDEIVHRVFEYTYRDYVETWYAQVSADHGNLHKMIRADYWDVVKAFSERLSKLDTVNLTMKRFPTCLLHHFEQLKLTAKSSPEDVKPSFTLHPCLRDRNTELTFLRHICEYILILTLPPEAARISSLRTILREILSGLALLPMVDSLCDPDYINQTILSFLQWRDTTHEDHTRAYAYAATYEDFMKIITECKSVPVLRQIRYRIMTEIIHATTISGLKKDQSKAAKARSMDKGELLISRNLKRYINQCQVAKQQCEKKIRLLGGGDYGVNYSPLDGSVAGSFESQLLSFEEIMTSPISRSFFLKYLKKIGRGALLNFWNQVEIVKTTQPTGKALAKLVSYAYQNHVLQGSVEQLPLDIDKSTMKGMQDCVIGNKSPQDFFLVQKQVYDLLKSDHYPSFVVSDIYTYQLMPEINDSTIDGSMNIAKEDLNKTAFGGDCSSDASLQRLRMLEGKLEYKAQALESLLPSAKLDPKVTEQLEEDIKMLQRAKMKQQIHMERTDAWWEHMGSWAANVQDAYCQQDSSEGSLNGGGPLYTIVVQCSGVSLYEATDDVSGWVVTRCLSDFHNLHHSLKEYSSWLRKQSLPKLPMFRMRGVSEKFLLESKSTLNTYLHNILKDEILRCSQIVYSFLSPGPDCTKIGEDSTSQSSKPTSNFGDFFKRIPKDVFDRVVKQAAEEENLDSLDDDEDRDSVAAPLYELISEIFELQGLFRFFRRSLIVFVRLAFGGSINRQVRETSEWLCSEPMLVLYLQTFLDSMWPGGKLAPALQERTEDEKLQTKLEVRVKLLQSIPEMLNGLVGQENAKRGVLKVFHALQDQRLNKHLFYTLLAEIIEEVFPEILTGNSN
uniref:sorting nexin-25 isoform X2 n=1 Tax=Ciona intestinalis TaxID=7719 RepID=UPI0005212DFD|nr:sorting nexin-25 isoform X2 [Ciona intestinalis]|eukprot:XP_026696627.1 sorting nexin-25 isoform X2 [Ciona intestinalis]